MQRNGIKQSTYEKNNDEQMYNIEWGIKKLHYNTDQKRNYTFLPHVGTDLFTFLSFNWDSHCSLTRSLLIYLHSNLEQQQNNHLANYNGMDDLFS